MPGAEAGARNPQNGNPWRNPAYNDTTGTFNYAQLRYSDTLRLTPTTPVGGFYFDIDSDSIPDRGVDFVINGFGAAGKQYTSTALIREAVNRGVCPAQPPSHIASLPQTRDFWRWRDGDLWIDSARSKLPDLLSIVIATDTDHVQSARDHPHIYTQYERFRSSGIRFTRLNPDRAYVEHCLGHAQPAAKDNAAFVEYTRLTIRERLEPEIIPDSILSMGAACELADRTCANDITPNLNAVIQCHSTDVPRGAGSLPTDRQLLQNHPNPFNASTLISFGLPEMSFVSLRVFDALGRDLATLVAEELPAGTYLERWDARGQASGVYFYRLQTGSFVETRKLLLLR
ncbi:MAG: T9SS type A sorting domain-containing protein [Bacteroidota bacterium]